jgi:hypothetical protein
MKTISIIGWNLAAETGHRKPSGAHSQLIGRIAAVSAQKCAEATVFDEFRAGFQQKP